MSTLLRPIGQHVYGLGLLFIHIESFLTNLLQVVRVEVFLLLRS